MTQRYGFRYSDYNSDEIDYRQYRDYRDETGTVSLQSYTSSLSSSHSDVLNQSFDEEEERYIENYRQLYKKSTNFRNLSESSFHSSDYTSSETSEDSE